MNDLPGEGRPTTQCEMSSDLELFYFPSSYFSQKVYLALYEKNLPFKKNYVYINLGEQNEECFLRLNPRGQVPVLKDGNDVISGSEKIIDYVDRKSDEGACLVPDKVTPLGRRVADLRKWLSEVPVEAITHGVLLHPGLQVKPVDELLRLRNITSLESYEKLVRASLAIFKERQSACPSLHDAMAKKIAAYQWKLDNLLNEHRVRGMLEDLQEMFDRIEREIGQSRTYVGTNDVWMCGVTFTAVDVIMAVLFRHLLLAGIDEEYYSATKRPLVFAYHERLFRRPAVRRFLWESSVEEETRLIRQRVIKDNAKKTLIVGAVIGIVAIVAYGVKHYFSKE